MLFTSLGFLVFLPVVLAVFAALPAAARWAWLLLASLFFYGAAHPSNLVFLGLVTVVVWACGALLERTERPALRRAWLAGGLVVLIGSLVALKFHDFAAGEFERAAGTEGVLPRLGVTAPAQAGCFATATA